MNSACLYPPAHYHASQDLSIHTLPASTPSIHTDSILPIHRTHLHPTPPILTHLYPTLPIPTSFNLSSGRQPPAELSHYLLLTNQALLEQSKATLRATFSAIMRKRVFTLVFERSSELGWETVEKLLAACRNRGVVLCTASTIKSLQLKLLEKMDVLRDTRRKQHPSMEVGPPHLAASFDGGRSTSPSSILRWR